MCKTTTGFCILEGKEGRKGGEREEGGGQGAGRGRGRRSVTWLFSSIGHTTERLCTLHLIRTDSSEDGTTNIDNSEDS